MQNIALLQYKYTRFFYLGKQEALQKYNLTK